MPTVSIINDVSALEGDSGFTNEVFTVAVSGSVLKPITVTYSTADGTATVTPGDDYVPQSGTLTFQPGGPTTMLITVPVVGNTIVEPNESYFVQLGNVTNAVLSRATAVGTILNDDMDLSITDASALQLTSGTTSAVFTISAIGIVPTAVLVDWSTADNTASAGIDYVPTSGVLTFAPGVGAINVTVPILGRALYHSPETFFVNLTSPTSPTNPISGHLTKGVGVGTITNVNEPPALYTSDVHVTTTQAGQQDAVFSVALDKASGDMTFVQYATADGTALAGTNYLAQSGTLSFAPGVTSQLVTVPVMTNGVYAPNEQFYLNLFNPVHAVISDPQGVGTIIFGTPPPTETILDVNSAGYGETNGWTRYGNTLAYGLDYDIHPAGTGSGFADWTFSGLAPGSYQVFAQWIPFSDRATNAPYTIYDGSTPLATVRVNQQFMPSDDQSNGVVWQSLGTFNTSTGRTLDVRLNDNANGSVVADAIRVVSGGIGPQSPQMDVSGGGQSIADSTAGPAAAALFSNGTDFGSVAAFSSSFINTFTITNTGNADLLLTGAPRVSISGANASDFTVVSQPPSTIAAGTSATFQVMFHPGAVGERTAVLSIPDNDPTQAPYTFNIVGTGTVAGPSQLVVDDSGGGFQASGGWVTNVNTLAYQGELRSDAAGQGAGSCDMDFFRLGGRKLHRLYHLQVPFQNRAHQRSLYDHGRQLRAARRAGQRTANWPRADVSYGGVMWKALSTLNVTSGTLSVNLNNQANGYVIADAVYLLRDDVASAGSIASTTASSTTTSVNTGSNTATSSGTTSLPASNLIHNAANALDVNGDGVVSPLDALILVDHLLAPALYPVGSYYMDVNGDGVVSPLDLLAVIDSLQHSGPQAAVAAPRAVAASAVTLRVAVASAQGAGVDSAASPAATASSPFPAAAVDEAISQMADAQAVATASSTTKVPAAAAVSTLVKRSSTTSKSGSLFDPQDS